MRVDTEPVTKQYVNNLPTLFVVSEQWDGGVPLPHNSNLETCYVVTTTGAHAEIGQVLVDSGTAIGTVKILSAHLGDRICTTIPLMGGAVELQGESPYDWSGSAWVTPSI